MLSTVIAACALISTTAANAAVVLTFQQVGSDVTATWSGTYSLPDTSTPDTTDTGGGEATVRPGGAFGLGTGMTVFIVLLDVGTTYASSLVETTGTYVGQAFGFADDALTAPQGASGDYSPVGTMTFAGTTLSALGASAFDDFLAFQGDGGTGGSRDILFKTVPEPSAVLLALAGMLGFMRRRR
jgi:MprA protease rhombosortase-interaction domain-containing protein